MLDNLHPMSHLAAGLARRVLRRANMSTHTTRRSRPHPKHAFPFRLSAYLFHRSTFIFLLLAFCFRLSFPHFPARFGRSS